MGSEWKRAELRELVEISTEKIATSDIPKGSYVSTDNMAPDFGGVTFNTSTPSVSKTSRFLKDDVLFSNIRTYFRKLWIADRDGGCSNDVIVFRAKKEIHPRFLFYSLMDERFIEHTVQTSKGTKMPRGDKSAIVQYDTAFPPLPEQKAIAHILGTLDDKIELNRRMNATLEGMAQALFKSWFVDFDPVIDNALAAGSPIPDQLAERAEVRREALANGTANREAAKLFPDAFQESEELGCIPAGWGVNTIEEIADRVAMGPFGSSIKVSTFVDAGIPVISGQHLKETTLDDNVYNYVTEDHAEKLKRSNVYRGDIIFTHAGNIGQVSLIPEDSQYDRYVISQRQFYLRCDLSKASPLHLTYFFRSNEGQHVLLANASQVGVPSISRPSSYLRTIPFVNPPESIRVMFDEFANKGLQKISANKAQVKSLTNIRDSLLPKLISGELEVLDDNKRTKEALS